MATPRSIKDLARSLIRLAAEERVVPDVLRDLKLVENVFRSDPRLAIDLDETSVELPRRQRALITTLQRHIHLFTLNTLLALQQRQLLHLFASLRAIAVKEAEVVANHREATVHTPTHLSAAERTRLTETLQQRFGGTVELTETLDHSLIGGIRITIGDWTLDDSVAGRLERLTHALYV